MRIIQCVDRYSDESPFALPDGTCAVCHQRVAFHPIGPPTDRLWWNRTEPHTVTVDDELRDDESEFLFGPAPRCRKCGHLAALHNTHCCTFCMVCEQSGEDECEWFDPSEPPHDPHDQRHDEDEHE